MNEEAGIFGKKFVKLMKLEKKFLKPQWVLKDNAFQIVKFHRFLKILMGVEIALKLRLNFKNLSFYLTIKKVKGDSESIKH